MCAACCSRNSDHYTDTTADAFCSVDPVDPDPRSGKGQELTTKERVKIQKDRKERADTLAGSVKSLLRRTRLNVEISCQACVGMPAP